MHPQLAADFQNAIERLPGLSELRTAHQRGDLVLLVGAGVSMAAGLPSWKGLVEELAKVALAGDDAADDREEIEGYVGRQQYVPAMSILARRLGDAAFHRRVRQLLDCSEKSVPEVAEAITELAPRLRYVLTTNLDRILERALGWEGVVAADGHYAHESRIVLKLHGTLRRPQTWVMKQDDYDRVVHADAATRQNIEAILRTSTVLFVGFGLVDDHFELLFARLRALHGRNPPPSFALLPAAEHPDRQRSRELNDSGLQIIPYEDHSHVPSILRAIARLPGRSFARASSATRRILGARYELLGQVGAGPTATIYKARDLETQDHVALRVLHPHLAQDDAARARFVKAAELTRSLPSDISGMVSVLGDVVEDQGTLLYATTFVDGVDLRRRVLDGGLEHDDLCEIVRGVARSLQALHERKLVHRGIAPNNILIDAGKHPWITELMMPGDATDRVSLYVAPIVGVRPDPDPWLDVYGLAMTMVFGLLGRDLSLDVVREIDGTIGRLECSVEVRELLAGILGSSAGEAADVRMFIDPLTRAQLSPGDINRINVRRAIERNLFNATAPNLMLGKFELITRVGGGAFSEVHRARDTTLDREVAIKMLTNVHSPNAQEQLERIRREARALTRVHHPHVVEVYDYDPHGSHPYIVLRFVEGVALSRWVTDHALGWAQILTAMRAAAEGLQAIHDAGLVHRDFKPANLIVEPRLHKACIVDFGLAGPPGPPSGGTPAYIAPEQAQGHAEPRSDQFSFCASLFEAFYGHRPFRGASRDEIQGQIVAGPPHPMQDPRRVPPGLLRVVQRGLAPRPDDRHTTMRELLAAIDAEVRAVVEEPNALLWEAMRGVFSRP